MDLSAPPPQSSEVALAADVTAQIAPFTGLTQCQANAELAGVMGDLRKGAGAAKRFGIDAGDLATSERQLGFAEMARAVIIGALTLKSWNVRQAGAPAPITETTVAAVFDRRPDVMGAFLVHIDAEARRYAAEGESWKPDVASSLARPGDIAPDASESAPPAPEASPASPADTAPAPNTNPAPPKASR